MFYELQVQSHRSEHLVEISVVVITATACFCVKEVFNQNREPIRQSLSAYLIILTQC